MFRQVTDPGLPHGTPTILWREEEPPADEATLVRLHIDDLNRVIKMSLNWWTAYRDVLIHLGRSGNGVLALSVFRVTDAWPLERIVSSSNQPGYRTASVGTLREAGYELWPTDQWGSEGRDQRSEVHYDVVLEVADGLPQGLIEGSKAERKAAREHVAPLFEAVLDLFGPVHTE